MARNPGKFGGWRTDNNNNKKKKKKKNIYKAPYIKKFPFGGGVRTND